MRVRQRDAIPVLQAARLVEVQVPRACRGTEQAFAEPRALLVRPIHQPHRHRRLAVVFRVDAPQDLHAGEHVETAVEPAAVRHGIDVAADEQAFFATRPAGWTRDFRPRRCGSPLAAPPFRLEPLPRLRPRRVKATRCAPLSSPVSARSSLSSATVRFGSRKSFPLIVPVSWIADSMQVRREFPEGPLFKVG